MSHSRSFAHEYRSRRHLDHGEARTLEMAIGRIAQAAVIILGLLVSITAAFPAFTIANQVSRLGVGGVALGFAFKDPKADVIVVELADSTVMLRARW